METDFLSPDDSRWQTLLAELPHDVYHTPEYLVHASRHEGGEPAAVVVRDRAVQLFVPLLLRQLPDRLDAPSTWLDAASPYGYAGPLLQIESQADAPVHQEMLEAFHTAVRKRGIVSAFVRWHPFFSPPPSFAGTTVLHGETVSIDLTRPAEELAAEVRSGHRYEIRRLVKKGFRCVINEWDFFAPFQKLYRETMLRVGAQDSYFFATDYFDDLRDLLGDQLHLGCILSPEDELVSASLFTETCGIVQYHLSATADAYRRMSPSKLLLSDARDWFQQRGNRCFHLGGGLGAQDDSLFRFKAGFSKQRSPFFTSRLVVDQPRYEWLVERWQAVSSSSTAATSFFPRYRLAA